MQQYLIIEKKQKVTIFIVLLISLVIFNIVISRVWANSITIPNSYENKSILSSLSTQNKFDDLEPLPTEIAFKTTASRQNDLIYISFKIAPKYYLYQEKIKLILDDPKENQVSTYYKNLSKPNFKVLSPVFSKATSHYDETFKKEMLIYRDQLTLTVPLKVVKNKSIQSLNLPLSLTVYSQGCADLGICYPPRIQKINFNEQQVNGTISELKKDPLLDTPLSELPQSPILSDGLKTTPTVKITDITNQTSTITQLMYIQPVWLWALEFVALGILLSFTPCVLPMIPIVLAMVLNKKTGQVLTTLHSLQRSVIYLFGMCFSYTSLGVLAGLAGIGLGGFLQKPWVLIVFAGLMVIMAGAQFNWYCLRLPDFLQTRLNTYLQSIYLGNKSAVDSKNNTSNTSDISKNNYIALFIMGALSAVVVSPCVTPPLAGILLFISQTQDALKGALALFSLSLGMGLPLLLITIGGANSLPKSGIWMQKVSYTFGILLLLVALWTLQSLISSLLFSVIFVALLLLLAEHLGAFHDTQYLVTRSARLFKAVALCILCWAFAIILGIAMGHTNIQRPLGNLSLLSPHLIEKPTVFETISSAKLMPLLRNNVNSNTSPYIVDIYADWCVSCIEFERQTLTDSSVQQALKKFKRLRVDVTNNTVDDQALMKKLQLFGPPAILFYSAAGQSLGESSQIIGFKNAKQFLQHLQIINTTLMNLPS
ncbi:MAG: protein-disulfide reductase DsbD [Pseudomonadota bacterium]|jgi:thiol:disulfide interchange protein DsbD